MTGTAETPNRAQTSAIPLPPIGDTATMDVNGVPVTAATADKVDPLSGQPFCCFGKSVWNGESLFSGRIDDFLIYITSSVIGHTYRIQHSPDLTAGTWENVGDGYPGTGGALQMALAGRDSTGFCSAGEHTPQPGGHSNCRPARMWTWRWGTASPPSGPLLITRRKPFSAKP